jgi:hypothetical protein
MKRPPKTRTKIPKWYNGSRQEWQQLSSGAKRKAWRAVNAVKLFHQQKVYREANPKNYYKSTGRGKTPERVAYQKKYYSDHKEKAATVAKKYQTENVERIAEQKKKYNAEHKEQIDAMQQKYRIDHQEERAASNKAYRDKKSRDFYTMFGDGLGM